jgi:hypothetical protein
VNRAFAGENVTVSDSSEDMFSFIKSQNFSNPVYLFLTSGDFVGLDITTFL